MNLGQEEPLIGSWEELRCRKVLNKLGAEKARLTLFYTFSNLLVKFGVLNFNLLTWIRPPGLRCEFNKMKEVCH